jgi:hypothetical protein
MTTNPKLELTDVPDPIARGWILDGLAESNRAHVREPGLREFRRSHSTLDAFIIDLHQLQRNRCSSVKSVKHELSDHCSFRN